MGKQAVAWRTASLLDCRRAAYLFSSTNREYLAPTRCRFKWDSEVFSGIVISLSTLVPDKAENLRFHIYSKQMESTFLPDGKMIQGQTAESGGRKQASSTPHPNYLETTTDHKSQGVRLVDAQKFR